MPAKIEPHIEESLILFRARALKKLADKLDIAASESEIRRQARSMSDAEIIQSLERTQVPMLRRLINLFRRIRLSFSKP